MPWRLIGFIVLFAVFLVFIGLNLENHSDISFGFAKLPDVPVYLTAFSSFVLGMLWAVPYVISLRFKRKAGQNAADKADKADKKKRSPQKGQATEAEEILPGPGGPYGID
ncbi:MAG: hypothetical protein LBP80_09885 [Treponema sp.]|jgi:uncharacterized integral membrane protein|nr:hypothetical protein [Treponema sp.]